MGPLLYFYATKKWYNCPKWDTVMIKSFLKAFVSLLTFKRQFFQSEIRWSKVHAQHIFILTLVEICDLSWLHAYAVIQH